MESQRGDPSFKLLFEEAEGEDPSDVYILKEEVLMHRRMPPSAEDAEWRTVFQIVVPLKYCHEIIKLAHDSSFVGHLGV